MLSPGSNSVPTCNVRMSAPATPRPAAAAALALLPLPTPSIKHNMHSPPARHMSTQHALRDPGTVHLCRPAACMGASAATTSRADSRAAGSAAHARASSARHAGSPTGPSPGRAPSRAAASAHSLGGYSYEHPPPGTVFRIPMRNIWRVYSSYAIIAHE